MIATLGLMLGLLAPAAQAAPAATSLVVSTSASTVKAGGAITVASTLTRAGKPLKSAHVQVQRKLSGTSTWKNYKSGTTDAKGRFAVKVTGNQRNHDYRALYKGSTTSKAATAKTKTVKVQQSVSITKTSSTSPTAGDMITVDGKTSPALKGSAVHLQIKTGSTWRTVGSSKVANSATFTVKARASTGGKQAYRVMTSGTAAVTSAASAGKTFNVYSWYYLSEMKHVGSSGLWSTTPRQIGGVQFTKSVTAWGAWSKPKWVDYNLSYKCRRLDATLGLKDGSPTGGKAEFSTIVDDMHHNHGVVALGARKSLSLDVSGTFRVRLSNANASEKGVATSRLETVWGNARALCVGNPATGG